MSYCIMRMAKIKSRVSLVRAAQHNTRERQPSNADEGRLGQNVAIGGTVEDVMKKYSALLPAKVRKNAVHAVELVFTASPDFSGSWDQYLEACGKWTADLFGEKNVLHIARHKDELTPHAHILVTPLKDGKLNANHFIGGSRNRMAELQDDFFLKVGKQQGLDRGQTREETKARHSQHTLAGKSAELEERQNALADRESKLKEREKKLQEFSGEFQNLMGMKPSDVLGLKNRLETWEKKTVTELKVLTGNMEKRGCRSVAEYRIAVEAQKPQQQTRKI